jgi:hypothetical protein
MTNSFPFNARWTAIGLFAITVLTRLPFISRYLYHFDSVNMAFGLRHFDVQAGAPQYPGYIVYILLGQLVNAFVHDEQATMVIISIISSGLAAAAIYFLGRDMFHPAAGILAAVFLISSPLVWFYGEIALPHTLDLFVITLALWLLYRIMQGEYRWLWLTAIFLALLGGIRQQDLLFLGPVILFALWSAGIRRIILFAIIGAGVSLAWFIPLVQSVGGLQNYMTGSSAYSQAFFSNTSILHGAGTAGLRRNLLSKLIPYTLYAWSLALLPAVLYWGSQIPRRWRMWLRNRKVWFAILATAPALAFYTFIHMGQQGLVFVFMPILFVLSGEGLRRLLPRSTHLSAAAAVTALAGAGIFALAPSYPLGESGPKLLTYDTILQHDWQIDRQIRGVRSEFSPDSAVLLAANWRHTQYYLPEYPLARVETGARWEADEGQLTDVEFDQISIGWLNGPVNQYWWVVVLDESLHAYFEQQPEPSTEGGPPPVTYVLLKPDESLVFENGLFRVKKTP